MRWQEFNLISMNTPSRSDYYLAQIACEVRRGNVKKPAAVALDHLLIKFEEKTKTKTKKPTQEEIDKRVQNSKAAWAGIVAGGTQKPPA